MNLNMRLGPQIIIRGGITLFLVFYIIINHEIIFSSPIIKPVFVILVCLTAVTLIADPKNIEGFTELSKIYFWMVLMIVIADMTKNNQISMKRIYQLVTISSIIFLISLFVSQKFGIQTSKGYSNWGANTGAFAPHAVAISLCMILNVIVYFIGKQKKLSYFLLAIILCSLIVFSILNTYVRTAYLASVIALISLIVLTWNYNKGEGAKRQKLTLVVIFLVMSGIVVFQISTHRENYNKRFTDLSNLDEKYAAGRLEIWKDAIKTYQRYTIFEKILGGGIGISYKNQFLGTGKAGTHNDYIFILLSGGLLGIVLFVWLFIVIIRCLKCSKYGDRTPIIIGLSTVVTYLVASMTNNVQVYPSVMTYFCFLVGGAIGYYQSQEKKELSPKGTI